jgi:hypothetical protein
MNWNGFLLGDDSLIHVISRNPIGETEEKEENLSQDNQCSKQIFSLASPEHLEAGIT